MAAGPQFLCFLEQSGAGALRAARPLVPFIVSCDGFQMPRSHRFGAGPGEPGQEGHASPPLTPCHHLRHHQSHF